MYQVVVTNEGNIKNNNVQFTDPLSNDVTFVADSVQIDDEIKTGYNPSTGFALPDLEPAQKTVVKFNVTVN